MSSVAWDQESPSAKLKRSFQTLGLVQDECSQEDIRKAYLSLAKIYHPDSRNPEANTDQFIQVSFFFLMEHVLNLYL